MTKSKILAQTMVIIALASLASPALAKLRVFACEPEWAELVKIIGGNRVEVSSATTGHQDVHYIEARPSLIAKARRADLIVCTGAELEIGWLPLLLRQAANPDVKPGKSGFFEASEFVELLEVPTKLDRSQGHLHVDGNPHIQLNPNNIGRVAVGLAKRMAALDNGGAQMYAQRHAAFAAKWKEAIREWEREAAPLRGLRVVVHHRSWVYLYDWLGLKEAGVLEPKPGIPPSASHLARLVNDLEGTDIDLIVRSTYQNSRPSEWLSRRTGAPAAILPHTVGSTEHAKDLFKMFDSLIEKLQASLPQ